MEDLQEFMGSAEAVPNGKAVSPEEIRDTLTPLDITTCFQLFLGYTPEPSRVNNHAFGAIPDLLRELFQSEEFNSEVLRPVLLREHLPQHNVADAPPLPLLDWVQRKLPITATTRCSCGAARTWTQLL